MSDAIRDKFRALAVAGELHGRYHRLRHDVLHAALIGARRAHAAWKRAGAAAGEPPADTLTARAAYLEALMCSGMVGARLTGVSRATYERQHAELMDRYESDCIANKLFPWGVES